MLAQLLLGCLLLGQSTTDEDVKPQLKRLVRQLDSDALAERESAEKSLLELGPKILPLLPFPTDDQPAEMKVRLGRVRLQLERTEAEGFTRESTVTYAGQDVPVSTVLAEIAKQTDNPLNDYRERFGENVVDPKITVKFEKTPFWSAVDQTFDLAGFSRYPHGEEAGVAYQTRPESMPAVDGRASYSGPFRMEPVEIELVRNLRRKDSGALRLNLDVAWEPRLRPIALFQDFSGLEIKDENGALLKLDESEAMPEMNVLPGESSTNFSLPLALPPRSVQRIASLKCKLHAMIPGRIETFKFAGLAPNKPAEQKKGGVTVKLEQIRKNNAVWEIRVLVLLDQASGALESHRRWVTDNPCLLQKGIDDPVSCAALELYRRDENSVGVAYLFDVPGDLTGYTLTYETPVLILKTPLEYELKNLDLP